MLLVPRPVNMISFHFEQFSFKLFTSAKHLFVLDFHKHRGDDEQTRAPVAAAVDVEVLQLVIDAAVSDVYLLEETIAELETDKSTIHDEVQEMYNSL